ncbi:Fanconi anemia group J protein, partial [Perkinsus olseni]
NTKAKNDQFVSLLNRSVSKEDSKVITECTKLIVTGGQSLLDDQLHNRELVRQFDDMARRVKKNPRIPVLWREVMEESGEFQPAAKRAKLDPTQIQKVHR